MYSITIQSKLREKKVKIKFRNFFLRTLILEDFFFTTIKFRGLSSCIYSSVYIFLLHMYL